MAKLSKQPFWVEYTTVDGEKCRVKLRRPTNDEVDDLFSAVAELAGVEDKKEKSRRISEARCAFYDSLFLESENLTDEEGAPITKENIGEIPALWKDTIVFARFENVSFKIKN